MANYYSIKWIFQIFYFVVLTFIIAQFIINSKEITVIGHFHSNYFMIKILDQFYIHLYKFNCGLINSAALQLLIFLALFFKNARSFNFIIKVTNQEYFTELYSLQEYYVHRLASSYFMQILSLFSFGSLSIFRIILSCIITFFSVIKVLWILWTVTIHPFDNIFTIVLADKNFYYFQLIVLLLFLYANDYAFFLHLNFISYFRIFLHYRILFQ